MTLPIDKGVIILYEGTGNIGQSSDNKRCFSTVLLHYYFQYSLLCPHYNNQ